MTSVQIIRRQTKATIAAVGFLLAVSLASGCAASSNASAPPSKSSNSDQSLSNANPQAPDAARCKEAINDISKYCNNGSNGRCDDAKSRSRKFCMKTN